MEKVMKGRWVIQGHVQRIEKTVSAELFYQFRPQGFLKMADIGHRWSSVRGPVPINEQFLCCYGLIIDWSIGFPIIGFHQLDTPGSIWPQKLT